MNKSTLLCFPMVLLFFLVSCLRNETNGQDRAAKFAGSFYPSSPEQIENMLAVFFENASNKQKENNLQAIVVPHAGYVYSGQTAAEAYSCIPKGAGFKISSLLVRATDPISKALRFIKLEITKPR